MKLKRFGKVTIKFEFEGQGRKVVIDSYAKAKAIYEKYEHEIRSFAAGEASIKIKYPFTVPVVWEVAGQEVKDNFKISNDFMLRNYLNRWGHKVYRIICGQSPADDLSKVPEDSEIDNA